jgi:hypothetical protein
MRLRWDRPLRLAYGSAPRAGSPSWGGPLFDRRRWSTFRPALTAAVTGSTLACPRRSGSEPSLSRSCCLGWRSSGTIKLGRRVSSSRHGERAPGSLATLRSPRGQPGGHQVLAPPASTGLPPLCNGRRRRAGHRPLKTGPRSLNPVSHDVFDHVGLVDAAAPVNCAERGDGIRRSASARRSAGGQGDVGGSIGHGSPPTRSRQRSRATGRVAVDSYRCYDRSRGGSGFIPKAGFIASYRTGRRGGLPARGGARHRLG